MTGGIFMSKNEQVSLEVLQDFREGRKTRYQAALLLGISERAVTRRAAKIRSQGIAGIKHGNFGRSPANRISQEIRRAAIELIKTRYPDFNLLHAHEILRDAHNINVSYMTLLHWCRAAGLGKRKRRRTSKARLQRERMANEGILLQMDGSHHKWNGKDEWCLISLIDDATSNIPCGQFYDGETSWNCMHLLRNLFETRGLPEFLYTDGAGWAGGGAKRQNFSQVVRACQELGIKIIRATSPQAKGRIERSFKTIQGRLIPEMRLKGIHTRMDANRYLTQVFWPDWNHRFTVEAREKISRYKEPPEGIDLGEVLCLKFDRQINNDHTFSFEAKRYKVDPGKFISLRRKHVTVHQYEDKSISIFFSGERLDHKEIVLPKRRWI